MAREFPYLRKAWILFENKKKIAGKISKSNKNISMGKSASNILEEIIIPESEILMPKRG